MIEEDNIINSFREMIVKSESSYKSKKYKRSFLERVEAKEFIINNSTQIEGDKRFRLLIKSLRIGYSKYNLINDYITKIDLNKKHQLCKQLESMSRSKFMISDFKGAIRALRRSENYY